MIKNDQKLNAAQILHPQNPKYSVFMLIIIINQSQEATNVRELLHGLLLFMKTKKETKNATKTEKNNKIITNEQRNKSIAPK